LLRESCVADYCNDAFQASQDLLIRESKHRISLRCEPCVAAGIFPLARIEVVRLSVELDNQTR
jgi:hypothetical protein